MLSIHSSIAQPRISWKEHSRTSTFLVWESPEHPQHWEKREGEWGRSQILHTKLVQNRMVCDKSSHLDVVGNPQRSGCRSGRAWGIMTSCYTALPCSPGGAHSEQLGYQAPDHLMVALLKDLKTGAGGPLVHQT